MSIQLLDKTRKINKLLHNSNSGKFVFSDICRVVGEVLESNVMVISKRGKVLGMNVFDNIDVLDEFLANSVGEYVDKEFNERLLGILSTNENVSLTTLGFSENKSSYNAVVTPIDIAGERLGTLFIYRVNNSYGIDDIILSEYGNTVVGLEMVRSLSEENENIVRMKERLENAVKSLSITETKAIVVLLKALGKKEGKIKASEVSDETGITRSSIVNALKKCESAGVIETHSNGTKGTYIKVLNDSIYDWMETVEV